MKGLSVSFAIVSLISTTSIAAEKGGGEMKIVEPIVRVAGKSHDMQDEAIALGLAVESGTIALRLESIEGLRKVAVLLADGKRATPTAIVMLPERGIALLLVDLKLRSALAAPVKTGGQIRVVRHDPIAETVIGKGLVSSENRDTGEFSVDLAASSPHHDGIVVDAEHQCLGVVVRPDASPLRCLDVEGIQRVLRQWRASQAKK